MAAPTRIDLGAFAAGEIPPPLEVTFTDYDGNALPLTGFTTLAMNIEAIPVVSVTLGTGSIAVTDAANGIVEYTWVEDDMIEPSDYTAQVWVSNGLNRYASDLLIYTVYDGPGDAP